MRIPSSRAIGASALLAAGGAAIAQPVPPVLEPLGVGAPGILGRQANRDAVVGTNAISADGRWVVFTTRANNLDASDRDGYPDVYLAAVDGSATQRISTTPPGAPLRDARRA
jgi:hypothetical protein